MVWMKETKMPSSRLLKKFHFEISGYGVKLGTV
jgi:hypothetical protein